MNFSQLQERLRAELLRRIRQGALTATWVARQAGVQPPHVSNFLHRRRGLTLPVLDRILSALNLTIPDLLPPQRDPLPPPRPSPGPALGPSPKPSPGSPSNSALATAAPFTVPLVSQDTAMHQDHVPASSVLEFIQLPAHLLSQLRAEHGFRRPARDRYVAIRISAQQAQPMRPLLREDALLILDRHSTHPTPTTRNIYAVRIEATLHFAFVTWDHNHLVLRPNSPDLPLHFIAVPPQFSPSDYITARICATLTAT